MDYAALKALIDSEPANGVKSDADVFAWLTETEPSPPLRDVPVETLLTWLGSINGLQRCDRVVADTLAPDGQREGARMLRWLVDKERSLRLSDPSVVALVAKVVPVPFSEAERDALYVISRGSPTRFEAAGLVWPNPARPLPHIAHARGLA